MDLDQGHGVSADGLTAADRVQTFATFGFHADLVGFQAESYRYPAGNARNVGSELRPFEPDGNVDIDDGVPGGSERLAHSTQEEQARSVLPTRRRVGEMPPDVAEGGRPQQGVTDGVGEHVAIGMADRTFLKRDPHTAQDQLAACHESVKIVPNAGTQPRLRTARRGFLRVS